MSVNIGDKNKIKDSNIAVKIEFNGKIVEKKSFYEKRPVICGFLISLAAGVVLLFSFWNRIISFVEGLF